MHMVGVVGLFAEEDRGSEVAECYLRVAAMLRDQMLFMHSFDAELRHSSAWPLPRTKTPYPLGSNAVIKAEPFRSKYEPSALITPLYEALADAKAQGVPDEDRDNSLRDWMFQGVAPLVGHMTGNAPPPLAPAMRSGGQLRSRASALAGANWDAIYGPNLPVLVGFLPCASQMSSVRGTHGSLWRVLRQAGLLRRFVRYDAVLAESAAQGRVE